MQVYEVVPGSRDLDGLIRTERPDPKLGPYQILVRVRATSLNYRDLALVQGHYPGPPSQKNLIPLSDGAGEVIGVGDGVTRFNVGDRVVGTFFQVWIDGAPGMGRGALGGPPLDGALAEQIVLHEDGLVGIPDWMSFDEAATLPCAGVTAWNALMVQGRQIKPGNTVLVLGTGGVSILALQFARAAGARVIATSSHDDKLDRAQKLGADGLINYKTTPEWEKEVMRLTDGKGVDCVVEVGGTGTLSKSMQSVGWAGKVCLIGVLTHSSDTNPHILMFKGASLHGIFVGNRAMFEAMLKAMSVNRIHPVIDKTFTFDEARDAYAYLRDGKHFGKIVIRT
jgi:NADPH:quinone reductase-like Zn-dependent oxidoreductase